MTTVGIVGYGFVGQAVAQLRSSHTVFIYDLFLDDYSSDENKKEAFTADVVFLCVPTLSLKDSDALDISVVDECAQIWADYGSHGVLVIKSTVPVGTTERLCKEYGTFNIIHNPEFLSEATSMQDFANAREIVAGGHDDACQKLWSVYKDFYSDKNGFQRTYVLTSSKSAELLKLARNSFYATKLTFMNEMSQLCSASGIDYTSFRRLFTFEGNHPWVSESHTSVPGRDGRPGFAGSCLPKDSRGLVSLAADLGIDLSVLKAAIAKNDEIRSNP